MEMNIFFFMLEIHFCVLNFPYSKCYFQKCEKKEFSHSKMFMPRNESRKLVEPRKFFFMLENEQNTNSKFITPRLENYYELEIL